MLLHCFQEYFVLQLFVAGICFESLPLGCCALRCQHGWPWAWRWLCFVRYILRCSVDCVALFRCCCSVSNLIISLLHLSTVSNACCCSIANTSNKSILSDMAGWAMGGNYPVMHHTERNGHGDDVSVLYLYQCYVHAEVTISSSTSRSIHGCPDSKTRMPA